MLTKKEEKKKRRKRMMMLMENHVKIVYIAVIPLITSRTSVYLHLALIKLLRFWHR
jgi:hypothetical protein